MRSAEPFESSVKHALDNYEVPYNSADWAKLEQALDQQRGPSWHASAGLFALLLGGSIAVASTLQVLFTPLPDEHGSTAVLAAEDHGTYADDAPYMVQDSEGPLTEHTETPLAKDLEPESPAAVNLKASASTSKRDGEAGTKNSRTIVAVAPVEKPITAKSTTRAIKISATEGCPGTAIDFALENASDQGIHLWNFGDGSFSNKARPSHTFSKAGSYVVMLSHSPTDGGSILHEPVSDVIVIHEAPQAGFSQLKQEYANAVPSVHFENRSVGGKSYHWDFGDGQTSTAVHPTHVFKKKGTYQVHLTVTNGNGCTDRTERTVRIDKDYDLLAAKTFSPNSDGVEDTFIPDALKTLGARFTLSIFDPASGQVLYETNDPQRPWNGRVNNRGDLCAEGEYVWVVEMKDGDKLGGTYNGQVQLLR
jgi:gliding motility-associated-like protein